MQTTSKNNSANTSASVLMINAQGIMLSVLGNDYFLFVILNAIRLSSNGVRWILWLNRADCLFRWYGLKKK